MKKDKIVGVIIITLVAVFLIGIVYLTGDIDITKDDIYKLSSYNSDKIEMLDTGYIFTNSNEAYKYFYSGVPEREFIDNNFVLIKIKYDPCSEENINLKSYTIDENNEIVANITYEGVCGSCSTIDTYYLVKVKKDVYNVTVKYNYKATKKEKCDIYSPTEKKPIIYLYPEKETKVEVKLINDKLITSSYPKYENSWNVTAYPDGKLIDNKTNRKLYGLYWEGKNHKGKIKDDGFVVKGEDTTKFLEDKLSILGLNEYEAEEFIIYWLPVLEKNKYNYIRFETEEEINNYMPMEVTPKPDTSIRIVMDYKPLNEKINIKEQTLSTKERKGFTLVEWGGVEIN